MKTIQLVLKEIVYQLADILIGSFARRKREGPVPVDFAGTARGEDLEAGAEMSIVCGDPQSAERADIVRAGDANRRGLAWVIRVKGRIKESSIAGRDQP